MGSENGTLDQAIASFRRTFTDEVISRSRVVNPLLDIWKSANAVDPSVARPLEHLLSVLPLRQAVSATELNAILDEVELAASAHSEFAAG